MAFRSFGSRVLNSSRNNSTRYSLSDRPLAPVSWKKVLICLSVSASLFLVPGVSQALRLVVNSWRGFVEPDTSQWRALGREAESGGDAATMACAAMRLPIDEAMPMAERAVAKDASLTWTYYFIRDQYFQDRVKNHDRRLELLTALSAWDPDNAAPYLALAENAEDFPASFDAHQFSRQWRWAMDHAVSAKTYTSYVGRRLELDRSVIQKHGIHEEPFDTFRYYGTVPIPSLTSTNAYAAFLELGAEKTGSSDAEEEAVRQLWSLANLGSFLRFNAVNDMERLSGSEMREIGLAHLQPILIRLGKPEEAHAVGYAARFEAEDRAKLDSHATSLRDFSLRGPAAAAHLFTILIIACSLMVATAAFTFAMRRTASQFVRSVLSQAPLYLVLSSVGFLVVSYPYAQASKSYLAGPTFNQNATMRLLSLGEIPGLGYYGWYFLPLGLWFWSSFIVVGIAICIWMGFRAVSYQVL
jgi:hypothetical protein